MDRHYWHCKLCGQITDNRLCWDCYNRLLVPCERCSKPTPSVTRLARPAKHLTCTACTSSLTADAHRIGVTCRVCGQRSHETNTFYQVCPACQKIDVPCPICQKPMAKYRKKGQLRLYCSGRCSKVAHPTTPEMGHKAGQTRFANHIYKSHQNRLARESPAFAEWRRAVFERDGYACQDCQARNGNGSEVKLDPHHLQPFANHPELRFDISNGITLCHGCHRKRHEHVFIGRTRKRDSRQLSLPID